MISDKETNVVVRTSLRDHLPLVAEGKVREIYTIDDETLLFVTTDRISAYDIVMKNGIPQKGVLLTLLSEFWFTLLVERIPDLRTHFIAHGIPRSLEQRLPTQLAAQLQDRSMQVRRLKVFPIEAIVRGYISGSAWSSYSKTGLVNGKRLPSGLRESEKLVQPIFTPSTKAEMGAHDENITREQAVSLIGAEYATRIADLSLQLYTTAAAYALTRGIIIADTKFEFALDEATTPPSVVLVDEVLTPDSSRFWRVDDYTVGRGQKSLDKQSLRDWLTGKGLNGVQGVEVPDEVALKTKNAYEDAFERLSGKLFEYNPAPCR